MLFSFYGRCFALNLPISIFNLYRIEKVNNMSSIEQGSLLEETRIVKASSRFDSLRTTIPRSVVNLLKLDEGDLLIWDLKIIEGKNHIFVEKSMQKRK